MKEKDILSSRLFRLMCDNRDAAYYHNIVDWIQRDFHTRHSESEIIVFGGATTDTFLPEYSDIDMIVVTPVREPRDAVVESIGFASTLYRSVFHLDILAPIVLDGKDIKAPRNPIFSANVLVDLRETIDKKIGNCSWLTSLDPSTANGFQSDAYYYRTWLRRQLATPSLALHADTFLKAILRWIKTLSIYILRNNLVADCIGNTIVDIKAEIGELRAHFFDLSPEAALKKAISLAPVLDSLCSLALEYSDVQIERISARKSEELAQTYLECRELIRRTNNRPVWSHLWNDQYLNFYEDIVA